MNIIPREFSRGFTNSVKRMDSEIIAILFDKGVTFGAGLFGTILGYRTRIWEEGGSWHNMLATRWIFQVGGPCLIICSLFLAYQDISRL